VYYLLEAEEFDCWLVNARDVKNVPGRPKTDLLTEPDRKIPRGPRMSQPAGGACGAGSRCAGVELVGGS
jgi:hypothetical protein